MRKYTDASWPLKASEERKLWAAAKRARPRAYAPYSKFFVGASALVDRDVFMGCNVENLSLGATICAERSLITRLVVEKKLKPKAICVVTELKNNREGAASPCGLCLQVMAEFFPPDFPILIANPRKVVRRTYLGELFPTLFKKGAF